MLRIEQVRGKLGQGKRGVCVVAQMFVERRSRNLNERVGVRSLITHPHITVVAANPLDNLVERLNVFELSVVVDW